MKKSNLPLFECIWSQSGLKEFKYKEGRFNSYYAPFCVYPLSSPVFGKGRFSLKDIDTLEMHFKKTRKGQKPFIFFEGAFDFKNWKKRGYQVKEIDVCYLTQPSKEVELPVGFSFEVIKFSSKKGKHIYREVACKVFGLDEIFLNGFHRLCNKMSLRNQLIVIYNRRKVPVALTGVVCFGGVGFLHSSCVLKRYQGKGIASWFVSYSFELAKSLGAESVVYTTSNQRMKNKACMKKAISFIE